MFLSYNVNHLAESCVFPSLVNGVVYEEYAGVVVNGRIPLGDRIYISCFAGYNLIGYHINYCQTSGEWSPGNFSCKRKSITLLTQYHVTILCTLPFLTLKAFEKVFLYILIGLSRVNLLIELGSTRFGDRVKGRLWHFYDDKIYFTMSFR